MDGQVLLCTPGGAVSFVMPQNWLFLTSYKKQRELLLKSVQWNLLARLGPGAFETITGDDGFFLSIETRDPRYDPARTRAQVEGDDLLLGIHGISKGEVQQTAPEL